MTNRILSALFLVAGLVACNGMSGPSEIIAAYRGGEVSEAEYVSWLNHKGKQDAEDNRSAMIETVAFTDFVSAQALANGLDADPRVRRACEEYERKLLVGRLRRELGRSIEVPKEEVDASLEANRDNLVKPPKVKLRNIFKTVPEGAGESRRAAVREEVESIRRALVDGADFAATAETESDSRTSMGGGLIGWVKPGDLSPSVEQVAFGLKAGQISEVLEGPAGFTILKCDKVMEGWTMSEEEARERITTTLRRRRAEGEWSRLKNRLLEAAAPRIDTDLLSRNDYDRGQVVVEFAGRGLTAGELELLLEPDGRSRSISEIDVGVLTRRINDLVFRIQAAERARELGYDRSPEFANHVEWRTKEILVTEEVARLVGQELEPPTDSEIRSFFEANRKSFVVQPRFNLAAILFTINGEGRARAYASAEDVLTKISDGQISFEDAARRYSEHPSAVDGGSLGWLSLRQVAVFGPRVLRTLRGMAPSQTSDLVQQDRKLWILRLLDRQEQRPMSFEEARARAEQELGNQRVRTLQQAIEMRLVQQMDLELK